MFEYLILSTFILQNIHKKVLRLFFYYFYQEKLKRNFVFFLIRIY